VDYTTVHPMSANEAHRIDLHLWRGPPQNFDSERPIQILVNQGYIVGFCPTRLQPAWSAYRVAHATRDTDFERPIHYHDDLRLPQSQRIGRRTFGKLGNVGLDVGHMTPNEVINRQFGRLAQMETFLMSNMSPQYGSLNKGVWLKLETAIREIEDEVGKDHVSGRYSATNRLRSIAARRSICKFRRPISASSSIPMFIRSTNLRTHISTVSRSHRTLRRRPIRRITRRRWKRSNGLPTSSFSSIGLATCRSDNSSSNSASPMWSRQAG
jgi:DNA/RNA non-specific endonuclease